MTLHLSIYHKLIFSYVILLWTLSACQKNQEEIEETVKVYYNDFSVPKSSEKDWQKFSSLLEKDTQYVNEFNLVKLPVNKYVKKLPKGSLELPYKIIDRSDLTIEFYPLNQEVNQYYQYTHQFKCTYDPAGYRYANVAYPNPCLGPDVKAKSKVILNNKSGDAKVIYGRMFYQNTSYWHPTNMHIEVEAEKYLENFYGGTKSLKIELRPGETKEVFLDFVIGQDPKGNSVETKQFYGPARPGNYEFMLWTTEDSSDLLIQDSLDYNKINPFAYLQKELLRETNKTIENIAYVNSAHFKFVFLKETFDGSNNYEPGAIYVLSDRDEKPLCDTCSNYFKDIIADNWTTKEFFKGQINDAGWTKAAYGNRKENVRIDENGIYLLTPGSTEEKKQKTWGEIKFGPSFLYGTVKVVAKFSQIRNKKSHTPTGTIHNLWLYQYNHRYADPIQDHPYAHYVNSNNKQPYEINMEFWSMIYKENWNGGSEINYSIVDYMKDTSVVVKPGDKKKLGRSKVDRLNNVQLNYPGAKPLGRQFFEAYHLYEIVWAVEEVIFKIDGNEVARIDSRLAKIPDEYAFLWIGSPIYQDGTFYDQRSIPFSSKDQFSHIRYIAIE